MKTIAFDTEVFFSPKLKYSLKTMVAEQFVSHELFDCYMVSVSDGETTWAGHPKDFNWSALEGATLLSHNARWDETCYLELVKRGLAPKLNIPAWFCTADMTSYLSNRRSLDQAVEHLLGIKVSKAARNDATNKHWPQDFTEAEQKTMLEYCRKDAHLCWTLWNKFSHKWPEKERRLSLLTRLQGRRGVQIDTRLLDEYICQSHEMKLATEKLLPWMNDEGDDEEEIGWEGFKTKPTSTKCIAEQCRRSGIPCPPVKAHEGEEAYEEWETEYRRNNPWIVSLSSWRSVNKLYKSFLTVKARLRSDGTMPFGLKYFGAHTGRWSGDAKINMQNMRKEPVLCTVGGFMESNQKNIEEAMRHKESTGKFPDWVKYALDFRALVIPRPGKKMIVSDLAQIEPRSLAWLVGDTQTLDFVRAGKSIYEAEARFSMGFKEEKLDKKSTIYAEAKARRLALGYGAGWLKFITMAQQYTGMDITEGDPEFEVMPDGTKVSGYGKRSREIVAAYREQNPLIADKEKGIWARLELAFKRSIGSDLKVVLPSGRVLRYEKVKCERKLKPDKDGKPRLSAVFTCDIGGRRFESYGGKLTENLVQAFARDVFSDHVLALNDTPGISVLFTSHDEAILEVDEHITKDDVEKIMSVCPEWCPGLPVAAEAKEVSHYLK